MGVLVDRQAFARFRDTFDKSAVVVFTNGCFDILHAGHFRLLRYARSLGDLLVVGMNSDASVRQLKGADRPIVPQEARAAALCGLDSVDFVTLFDELDPVETIRAVRPAIHVKGGDYRPEELPEGKIIQEYGGKVVIMPLVADHSTSLYVARARGFVHGRQNSL